MKMRIAGLAVFLGLGVALAEPAYAYLDPATGSIILQGLIAAVAGIAVAARLYWSRIKRLFGQPSTSQSESADAEEAEEDAEEVPGHRRNGDG